MIVGRNAVLNVMRECPEAKYALEKLFPELKKQTKTLIVTEASFIGKDIGGCSKEGKLDYHLFHERYEPREFTKITFEWEEERKVKKNEQ